MARRSDGIYGSVGLGGSSAGWGLRGWRGWGVEGFEGVEGACSGEARADSPEWLCSCHSKGENLNERVEE